MSHSKGSVVDKVVQQTRAFFSALCSCFTGDYSEEHLSRGNSDEAETLLPPSEPPYSDHPPTSPVTQPKMSFPSSYGRLYSYFPGRNLTLFEYLPDPDSGAAAPHPKKDTLLFIGGLSDAHLSVKFLPVLASYLNRFSQWAVMEATLSSSGVGWGIGNLDTDVEEMEAAVQFIKTKLDKSNEARRVVVLGHSTGSQDVLQYLFKNPKPSLQIDGAIMQAAVSDREGLVMLGEQDPQSGSALKAALNISSIRDPDDVRAQNLLLPANIAGRIGIGRASISYSRFLSVLSPLSPARPSADDLFSSDLSDETLALTFGNVGASGVLKPNQNHQKPSVLILLGEEDEYTPKSVDQKKLLGRWTKALEKGGAVAATESGVIEGASHAFKEDKSTLVLTDRVFRYLSSIDGADTSTALKQLAKDIKGAA